MKRLPLLALIALLSFGSPSRAADGDADWKMFGGLLSLVQSIVHAAATSEDPEAAQKRVDDILAGRSSEANTTAENALNEMLKDMPAEYRGTAKSLARDIQSIARREAARAAAPGGTSSPEVAIQARKDLAAMGLRYFDAGQLFDAVRRDDALAVELFVNARGINLAAKDADGRTALDIARANSNAQIVRLLSRAAELPPR